MSKPVFAVFGAGGFGREVMPLAKAQLSAGLLDNEHELVYIEDAPKQARCNGCKVMSTLEFAAMRDTDRRFIVAVGDPTTRRQIVAALTASGASPFSMFGGQIIDYGNQVIGDGLIACTYSLIHPNCKIGAHVHLNIYSYVAHDAVVGDFVTLAPKAAINGHVTVGDGAYIGTGAVTKEGVTIGAGAIVGAGAVIIRDVPPGAVVVGNPGTVITLPNAAAP